MLLGSIGNCFAIASNKMKNNFFVYIFLSFTCLFVYTLIDGCCVVYSAKVLFDIVLLNFVEILTLYLLSLSRRFFAVVRFLIFFSSADNEALVSAMQNLFFSVFYYIVLFFQSNIVYLGILSFMRNAAI